MGQFQKGQRIKVSFETTVDRVSDKGGFNYVAPSGAYIYVPPGQEGTTVEIMDPPNWPPQVGDVWEADGLDYYVRQYQGSHATLVVEPFDKDNHSDIRYSDRITIGTDRSLDGFKALNPVLVRRR